jgi:muramoyltetrapeptide carboxypeptidase
MQYIKPTPLKTGDSAVIISPAGNVNYRCVSEAQRVLESWGINVQISEYAFAEYGRFAGTVDQRYQDIQSAMDRDDIQMIFCSRGGYGVVQYLDRLSFDKIKVHPKWLIGFSDVTALHQVFLQERIISLHAPMAKHLAENKADDISTSLKNILFSGKHQLDIPPHPLNRAGNIMGRLFGGNLAVFCGLLGSKYISVPTNGIMFIEDIAESPYKIDRMLWGLKYSGILSQIKGLVVGRFEDCQEDESMKSSINELIRQHVAEYDYPVVFNFPLGHIQENFPVLHGCEYILEVSDTSVSLTSL